MYDIKKNIFDVNSYQNICRALIPLTTNLNNNKNVKFKTDTDIVNEAAKKSFLRERGGLRATQKKISFFEARNRKCGQ